MAKLIDAGDGVATPGERRAIEVLSGLPSNWLVVANKILPSNNGFADEIDLIVVGNHHVFVIDEKSWTSPIRGTDQVWLRRDGTSVPSPLNKLEYVSRRVAEYLRRRIGNLPHGRQFVLPRILFSAPGVQLDIQVQDPRASSGLLFIESVCERLIAQDSSLPDRGDLGSIMTKLEGELFRTLPPRKTPLEIGQYKVEELVEQRPGVRVFRAVHPENGKRNLIVFAPSSPERREKDADRFRKETEALKALQSTGVVPRIGDSLIWDGDHVVVPVEVPEGQAIGTLALPQVQENAVDEIRLAAMAFDALDKVHQTGVVHRAINPANVLVDETNAKVILSGFLSAHTPGNQTIVAQLDESGIDDRFAAPEIWIGESYGFAEAPSDVYSLALVWAERLSGWRLDQLLPSGIAAGPVLPDPLEANAWPLLDEASADALYRVLSQALGPGTIVAGGPQRLTAREVSDKLTRIATEFQKRIESDPSAPLILDGRFEVRSKLGVGPSCVTYLVHDAQVDALFVAKHYYRTSSVTEEHDAVREFKLLWKHQHPNLPRPAQLPDLSREAQFLLEWIDGASLRQELPIYINNPERWRSLAKDLCSAVEHLEEIRVSHRDIKPENIVIRDLDGTAILIDYASSAPADLVGHSVGTPRYAPPEWFLGTGNPPAMDLYALAATLFEALTGILPYRESVIDRTPIASLPVELTPLAQRLAQCLLRGVQLDPSLRFTAAKDIWAAIARAWPDPVAEPVKNSSLLVNPWVDQLRGLIRNSSLSNSDNRGLDTPFAKETYVSTALDDQLRPMLLQRRPSVVFLAGNPGDGKTAYLESMRSHLIELGGTVSESDPSGWEIQLPDGHEYRACFDASESHGQFSADDQLANRLRGLEGDDLPHGQPITVLVAINDGRLNELCENFVDRGFLGLVRNVDEIRERLAPGSAGHVWLVDLKGRTYVGHKSEASGRSVMRQMLHRFTSDTAWRVCAECSVAEQCPIRGNAEALRRTSPDAPQERLERLLLLAHLRGERHVTMRDLRSGLAYLITADLACEDVHAAHASNEGFVGVPDEQDGFSLPWKHAYWNVAFTTPPSRDLLLGELAPLNPARFPEPELERFWFFHQRQADTSLRAELFTDGRDLPFAGPVQQWLAAAKRRLTFEGRESRSFLGAYRHAEKFTGVLTDSVDPDSVLRTVLNGITRL